MVHKHLTAGYNVGRYVLHTAGEYFKGDKVLMDNGYDELTDAGREHKLIAGP